MECYSNTLRKCICFVSAFVMLLACFVLFDLPGDALAAEEAGESTQYAAVYESADGTVTTYTETLSAAVKLAKSDADTVTLLKDVDLGDADCMSTTGSYRLEIKQGFVLDLNGHVLSSDKSLLRFMNGDTTTVSTLTIKNGTLVAAANDASLHVITVANHGGLILENVNAYCGAFYADGEITVNEAETSKSSGGACAVVMTTASGSIEITDSYLCTYGNYNVINTNNKDTNLAKGAVYLKNSVLKTYGTKNVFGSSDGREYTVTFLDNKTTLTTSLPTDGGFASVVNVVPYAGYDVGMVRSYSEDGQSFYDYALVATFAVTWVDADGNVLEQDQAAVGTVPEYNGAIPEKASDASNSYVFSGWSPAVAEVTQAVTYTATFGKAPADYARCGIALAGEADLYRVQGRPYLANDGLYMDFAGAAIEFEAEFAGGLTITYDAEEPVYVEVAVDGVPSEWVFLPKGSGQTTILENYVTPGRHQVRIIRDSDVSTKGERLKVYSIAFAGKKETVKPTPERELYIEFVGDSITSGKYTVMENLDGVGIHKGTNSYAYQIAQLLNADYSMVSRGGCGYFRVSSCPIPAHKIYPYYNAFADAQVEYIPQRKADVVVLALGTNDNKTAVQDSYANGTVPFKTFVEAPRYMINQIRRMHGENVKIIILQNMMTGSWETELREAAEAEGVYFLKVTQDRTGGSNHPSTEGHTVIANELKAFLEQTVFENVRVCGGENGQEGKAYPSVQSAVNALEEGQYLRLTEDTVGDAEISGDVYIDLGGHTLTGNLSGTGTLYGMDASGDKYTRPTGRIDGTVTCNVAGNFKTSVTGSVKRYFAISDTAGYTFHRIYVGITHMSLRPTVDGVGYKAVFAADNAVKALLAESESYGFTLWVGENGTKHSVSKPASGFVSGKAVSLRLQNFDVENYGETPVYGQVFLKFADGTVIESAVQSYTLRSMLENVAANATALSDVQLTAVQAMVARFAEAMQNWLVDSLR